MNRRLILVVFLALNFGALGLGSYFMGGSPATNNWYQELPKAPWTPPGWVFGAAWFTIMSLFSIFMSVVLISSKNKTRTTLIYVVQLILNISWNPIFFYFHEIFIGLIILIMLLISLLLLLIQTNTMNNSTGFLLMPYLIWLAVAISLNLYPLTV
jgi:benzodiazapine receptor